MPRSKRTQYPKRFLKEKPKKHLMHINQQKETLRVDILLLISTFLFGITVQILDKYETLSPDFKGLILESSILLLFGAYLFLLASWGKSMSSNVAKDYEQIAVIQLLILNGLTVSVLVSYAISLLGTNETILGQNEESIYVLLSISLFVILPMIAYSRSLITTFGTVLGFPLYAQGPDVPIILGAMTMAFFFMMIFTTLLAYSSRILNIIAMASIFIYLPYLSVRTKYSTEVFRRAYSHSVLKRYIAYSLGIYRAYFFVMVLSIIYDYFKNRLSLVLVASISVIVISTYIMSLCIEKYQFSILIGIMFLGICLLLVVYIIFIRSLSTLFGAVFIIYMTFVFSFLVFALIMKAIDKFI